MKYIELFANILALILICALIWAIAPVLLKVIVIAHQFHWIFAS